MAWAILADKKRWRELFPVSILAVSLGLLSDVLMQFYPLWEYNGGHLLVSNLFDDFGCYIVVPYLFIQWLPEKNTFWTLWLYFFVWTGFAVGIEVFFLITGSISHNYWWKLQWSYLADWILFWIFYKYYKIFKFGKLSPSKYLD
ncbi:MAG: hypothetical protein PHO01_07235 [Desulfotomaculaceae bacterium]|nr:hypothetical protein [Desulfotomaculaceae bacterium]